jgi:hypothetical protein
MGKRFIGIDILNKFFIKNYKAIYYILEKLNFNRGWL